MKVFLHLVLVHFLASVQASQLAVQAAHLSLEDPSFPTMNPAKQAVHLSLVQVLQLAVHPAQVLVALT